MDWMQMQEQAGLLARAAGAAALGGAIGWERERASKPAGLRTHMLVALAAALLVGLGDAMMDHFVRFQQDSVLRADPFRILQAIIAGVSFLGAGTIIRNRKEATIEGLTTAASLLLTMTIGVCAALNQWVLAGGAVIFAWIALRAVASLERKLGHDPT